MKISRVELKPDETVVHVLLKQRTDRPLIQPDHLAEEAHLWAEGQRYALLSVDDNRNVTAKTLEKNLAFHYQPLPMQTKAFYWIGGKGGAFQIKGIQAVEERWNCLFPSYWLDEKTGEWVIAFFEDKIRARN